jgi:hypothetical protein
MLRRKKAAEKPNLGHTTPTDVVVVVAPNWFFPSPTLSSHEKTASNQSQTALSIGVSSFQFVDDEKY